jgi:hypothetical protein
MDERKRVKVTGTCTNCKKVHNWWIWDNEVQDIFICETCQFGTVRPLGIIERDEDEH